MPDDIYVSVRMLSSVNNNDDGVPIGDDKVITNDDSFLLLIGRSALEKISPFSKSSLILSISMLLERYITIVS